MKEGDNMNRLKLTIFLLTITFITFLTSCQESISFSTEEVKKQINQSQIIVDIKGAVVFPGIYSIDENMLLIDVVKLAGGFTDQADTTNINLAMPIGNNQMIIIPLIKETNVNQTENNLININTSSLTELTLLPGIGETKAQNIIDYRTNNGNFTSIEQLKEVKGISESVFNKIKTLVTL